MIEGCVLMIGLMIEDCVLMIGLRMVEDDLRIVCLRIEE
jgi:hypothetical protein